MCERDRERKREFDGAQTDSLLRFFVSSWVIWKKERGEKRRVMDPKRLPLHVTLFALFQDIY